MNLLGGVYFWMISSLYKIECNKETIDNVSVLEAGDNQFVDWFPEHAPYFLVIIYSRLHYR